MKASEKKQNTFVIVFAVIVILISIVVTLYATGVIKVFGGGEEAGYRNITFTDAVLTCRDTTENTYGNRIQTLVTDNHSSRYDGDRFLYKIFLKMDLFSKDGSRRNLHYINCFVKAGDGRVRKYEVYEEAESNGSRVSDDTNMFGMPKNK